MAGIRKVNHSGFYWSKRWLGGSGIRCTICRSFASHSGPTRGLVMHRISALTGDRKATAHKHLSLKVPFQDKTYLEEENCEELANPFTCEMVIEIKASHDMTSEYNRIEITMNPRML